MIKSWIAGLFFGAVLSSCNGDPIEEPLTREQLLNPETCKDCHPSHYRQWSSSMHAYASEDPVFRAMNTRGQREAQIGDFCVQCHAPMAVREGMTTDGLNLDQLPSHLKGVTCYFCHNAIGVGEPHNNSLMLANDLTMRGGITDPVKTSAHGATYSAFHDNSRLESTAMCGSCHDIVNPNGVHLERTFAEYKESLFSMPNAPSGTFMSCQGCHMEGYPGAVAQTVEGVKARTIHEHLWPAVDIALTPFPEQDVLRLAVEQCQLPNGIRPISIEPADGIGLYRFVLETVAGHNMPSGASQDRRMWLEVVARDAQGNVTHESGTFADDAPENFDTPNPAWTLNDRIFNASGEEVHMFWEAAFSEAKPTGYDGSSTLPAVKTLVQGIHIRERYYNLGPAPARADVRVRMRPMAREVLDDLVRSGDLDASIVERMPSFIVRSFVVTWPKPGTDPADFTVTQTSAMSCQAYKCLLRGGTPASCGTAPAP